MLDFLQVYSKPKQKVFGIGLHRTGTTSLTEALRVLGYRKSVHYPLGVFSSTPSGCRLVKSRAKHFDAITDLPAARFYKELDDLFPGSKFVFTIRDEKSWLRSMRRLRKVHPFFKTFFPKVDMLAKEMFGPETFDNEDELIARFRAHEKAVRTYFSGEREKNLLVLDVREPRAWRKLAQFLGRRTPPGAFPRRNKGFFTTPRNAFHFLSAGL